MTVRSAVAQGVTAILGLPPVAQAVARRSPAALRVIAFHDVLDAAALDAHLRLIVDEYAPVSEAQVRAATAGGPPLPDRAVWVTFDDGHPSVVSAGLEVLAARRVPATVYVCPGLIDDQAAPWWTVVEAAGQGGRGAEVRGVHHQGRDLVRALKTIPDTDRRAIVEELRPSAERHLGAAPALTEADLARWLDAGNAVGNHTWDHPCLDRCEPEEQIRQIRDADAWLRERWPDTPPSFAYPNGDHTDEAERELLALGYDTALLFDHRIQPAGGPSIRTSRLRLDADAAPGRGRAVLSGAHSAVLGLRG